MVASRCALEFTHFGKRIDHEATPRGVGHGPTPFSVETGLDPTPFSDETGLDPTPFHVKTGLDPTPFLDETGLGPTPRGVAACSIFLAKIVNFSFNW